MMRLTTFGHCVQLTFMPRIFPVNCYLVKENATLTLVDAALSSSAEAIRDIAASLQLPIANILLTHAHSDHVGALDKLHTCFPKAQVLISERDSRLLSGDMSVDASEPQAEIRGGLKPCHTKPTGFLREGDRIGHLEVISCPGHTPGHVALLDTRDGTLLAGDALQTRGGIAVSGTLRPLFPFPTFATWHAPTALESAKRLRQLQPSRLAVGHGNILENPVEAMERAIEQSSQRQKRRKSYGTSGRFE